MPCHQELAQTSQAGPVSVTCRASRAPLPLVCDTFFDRFCSDAISPLLDTLLRGDFAGFGLDIGAS